MRGRDYNQGSIIICLNVEERIADDHPLRAIRTMCDKALATLSPLFAEMYSKMGRRSVPPEKLIRALLLQMLYSIRSERMLMEQMQYNLLFRWFVGLGMEEAVWDATVFSKNRDRLLRGNIAQQFFAAVTAQARELDLLSDEHFTVDGTLLEAWAGRQSFQKKDTPPERGTGARGNVLLRDTHECKTDPDAKMYRKSRADSMQLCHMGHVLMDNGHGLPVCGCVTEAITDAEWDAAVEMLGANAKPHSTVGADAGYDCTRFVQQVRAQQITPHVAQHTRRPSAIDGRTTRHPGYSASLRARKRIEPIFGWLKTTAMMRKLRHRGRALVDWMFQFALGAYTLVRLRTLTVQ